MIGHILEDLEAIVLSVTTFTSSQLQYQANIFIAALLGCLYSVFIIGALFLICWMTRICMSLLTRWWWIHVHFLQMNSPQRIMVVSDLKKEPSHWISTGSRAYLHFKIVYPVDLMNETLVPSIILISLFLSFPPSDTGQRCPVDNEVLREDQLFPDNFAKREILSLTVHCTNVGCTDKMELRRLDVGILLHRQWLTP